MTQRDLFGKDVELRLRLVLAAFQKALLNNYPRMHVHSRTYVAFNLCKNMQKVRILFLT
jgi:hypothetical protein